MSSSVSPSAKNSWSMDSVVRSRKGSTATDLAGTPVPGPTEAACAKQSTAPTPQSPASFHRPALSGAG